MCVLALDQQTLSWSCVCPCLSLSVGSGLYTVCMYARVCAGVSVFQCFCLSLSVSMSVSVSVCLSFYLCVYVSLCRSSCPYVNLCVCAWVCQCACVGGWMRLFVAASLFSFSFLFCFCVHAWVPMSPCLAFSPSVFPLRFCIVPLSFSLSLALPLSCPISPLVTFSIVCFSASLYLWCEWRW
jgi:hypothetical protein